MRPSGVDAEPCPRRSDPPWGDRWVPLRLCRRPTLRRVFENYLPLELGDAGEDVEHQVPCGGGVYRLPLAVKLHLRLLEPAHQLQQVTGAPSEPAPIGDEYLIALTQAREHVHRADRLAFLPLATKMQESSIPNSFA